MRAGVVCIAHLLSALCVLGPVQVLGIQWWAKAQKIPLLLELSL